MMALRAAVGAQTAGLMLTNPLSLGVFERDRRNRQNRAHAGGLLYHDGANRNAILGKVRPGDMGFDVMHMNLHNTFSTPHGSEGPGAGAIGVSTRLLPFMSIPIVGRVDFLSGNQGRLGEGYVAPSTLHSSSPFEGPLA